MAISSSTLFHFTREYRFLKQTLEEGLWPRYCIEKKWNGKDLAIPMICFCDIPLSQVKEHIVGYGSYGIGVNKKFARKNKITPVTYLYQDSLIMNKLKYFLSSFSNPSVQTNQMDYKEMMLYYVKKVRGYNKDYELNRKFYDEREWRYIPQISQKIHLEILQGSYDEKVIVNELSERTGICKLHLLPEDITYVIVKEEGEVKQMIDLLKRCYSGYKQLELLFSRILTVRQIKRDF